MTLLRKEAITNLPRDAMPSDPALPGLVLLDPPIRLIHVAAPLLRDWLGPHARLLDGRVTVKRFVAGKRCIFELELTTAREKTSSVERRRLIGKIYAKDHGEKAYHALQALKSKAFAGGRFLIPEPLAYDSTWRLLLVSRAKGKSLRALLVTGSHVSRELKAAAEWLLQLHQCGIRIGRAYTTERQLHTLAMWKKSLTEVFPEAEPLMGNLLRQIAERKSALPPWKPAPTHRDFSPDHLIVDGDRITGLDFDEFCQYDPLFDVAHFQAHLRLLSLINFGALDRFDSWAQHFESCYLAGAQDYSADRVRFYEAIAYFKLAHIAAAVRPFPNWKHTTEALLGAANRLAE